MTLRSNLIRLTSVVALSLIASTSLADDPPAPKPIPQHPDEIKPLPPVAIPDDPPPHEGAMFDLPQTIEPPDHIVVEVLEALPGRPITGERLIRPDGTISLGFYGDVHVRGLTTEQAKSKILLHLRNYINDEVLGLTIFERSQTAALESAESTASVSMPANPFVLDAPILEGPPLPNPGRSPFELEPPPSLDPPQPASAASRTRATNQQSPSTGQPGAERPRRRRMLRRASAAAQSQQPPTSDKPADPAIKEEKTSTPEVTSEPEVMEGRVVSFPQNGIDPAKNKRVFVDFASYNHHAYYVQGDVGVPGRLPCTGNETVLDALNYAGRLLPSAEPTDIHLYRPARGGKPSKDYKIDVDAILKGDARANLQMFPGDRLIVGRNPIVEKTIQVDRAASLLNSAFNSMLQYSFNARSMAAINSPPSNVGQQIKVNGQNQPVDAAEGSAITPARRDEMVRAWVDFLWSISSKEGGAMLDEKAFREALMKKLSEPTEPRK